MKSDLPPGMRSELRAALNILVQQIDGLEHLMRATNSGHIQAAIRKHLPMRTHRRDLIMAVLADINSVIAAIRALKDDGYPNVPFPAIPKEAFQELQALEARTLNALESIR